SPASATPGEIPPPRDLRWLLALLFGLSTPVTPRAYLRCGFALMLIKYAIDAGAVYVVTGRTWTGLDYLNPIFAHRDKMMAPEHKWLLVLMILWTLPFMWIGI